VGSPTISAAYLQTCSSHVHGVAGNGGEPSHCAVVHDRRIATSEAQSASTTPVGARKGVPQAQEQALMTWPEGQSLVPSLGPQPQIGSKTIATVTAT
jgi:hypothetical protein